MNRDLFDFIGNKSKYFKTKSGDDLTSQIFFQPNKHKIND